MHEKVLANIIVSNTSGVKKKKKIVAADNAPGGTFGKYMKVSGPYVLTKIFMLYKVISSETTIKL